MSEQTDKCANLPCHCPVSAGKLFCSEQCEQSENDPDTGGCRCDHVECQQEHFL